MGRPGRSAERQLGRVDGHQPRVPRAVARAEGGEVEAAGLGPGVEPIELEALERRVQRGQVDRSGRPAGPEVHAEEEAASRAQVATLSSCATWNTLDLPN